MTHTDADALEITLAEVDGIPVTWARTRGDFTGVLIMGVGGRDLSPTTAGLHHLVEHLVMHRVGRVTIEHNASSDLDSLQFYASGSRELVTDFLERVGAAIASLGSVTDAEVAVEVSTIAAEVGMPGLYASTSALSLRWGVGGLGIGDVLHAPLGALRATDVHAFAARWMVSGNAHLVFTDEPPTDVALGLPAGEPAPHQSHPEPLEGALPALAFLPDAGVTVSFTRTVGEGAAGILAGQVVEDALTERLRLEQGQVYTVMLDGLHVTDDTNAWVLSLDPDNQRAARVAVDAIRELRRLADEGPDAAALDHARSTLRAQMSSSSGQVAWLCSLAEQRVLRRRARPGFAETLAALDALGADDVRAVLQSALPSLLLTLPSGAPLDDATTEALDGLGLAQRRPYRTYDGMSAKEIKADLLAGGEQPRGARDLFFAQSSAHKGKFFGPQRGNEIWLGPRQLAIPEIGVRVRAEDVVLIGADDDGDVEIVTRTGGVIVLNPAHFRGATQPWATFMRSIDPTLVRDKVGLGEAAEPNAAK